MALLYFGLIFFSLFTIFFILKGEKASQCTTGTNPKYQGLCSEDEDYNKHADADTYFANESPIVTEWLKSEKNVDSSDETISYKLKL